MNSAKTSIFALIVFLVTFPAAGCSNRGVDKTASGNSIDTSATATLEIVIEGIANRDGVMRLALFDAPDGFPGKMERVYRRLESPITGETVEFKIDDVTSGRYAVSVYHDENGNDSMETDVIGRPSEGYGFSNNAKGRFGPPSFDDASFVMTGAPLSIRIELKY